MQVIPLRFFTYLFLTAITASIPACKKDAPVQPQVPAYKSTVDLTLAFASCTGAALKLSISDPARPQNWELRRDGVLVKKGLLFAADTALIDEALAPSHLYKYQVFRLDKAVRVDSSVVIPVTTMDTTSHDYGFEISYLGDGESQFYDVYAVSDTEAYAVGDLSLRGPNGRLSDSYNGARWDGGKWELIKIPVSLCGSTSTGPAALTTCYGISPNNFLFSEGGEIIRFDGFRYKYDCYKLPSFLIMKMWGIENKQYFVGSHGSVAYWDGTNYSLLATPPSIDLTDVWGNEHEVWAVGGQSNINEGIVLFLRDKIVYDLLHLSNNRKMSVHSVWCEPRSISDYGFAALCGYGLKYNDLTWKSVPGPILGGGISQNSLFLSGIRGRSRRDVFAVGDYGNVVHFNGKSWVRYPELFEYPGGRVLYRVAVSENFVFMVGEENGLGLIITGKRR